MPLCKCCLRGMTCSTNIRGASHMSLQLRLVLPPLSLSISLLVAFATLCSMRPFPGIDIFCQLMENIMADGLETSSEPLLVIQPDELVDNNVEMSWPGLPAHEAPRKGFSIGYTKGMARMCTALSLLHWIWEMALISKKVTLSSMRVFAPYISIT